ncbi:cilia- and flagella-associated protein 36 [Leptinotarsa decemlineata]|uniref:cilia- and flagella-associated protein 36 n=1 Tax=Leptinotarsa decemlineata TaxID=7539 RepID=UPI000C254B27|nr:cilia- and flagella-associated protein 36 [Leptinotarsa decemlineata]
MEEDNSWVFDSLVCFLNGPIWNAPLQTFIEEKSLIFEPNVEDNEEYKHIFDEYKNLVDFMLGNFMEDIGITPEQFENACIEGKKHPVSFDQNLFEQIWAANDYEIFRRIMTQRNVELQLQALELIEQKYGITPQSFIPKHKDDNVKEIPIIIEKSSDMENEVMEEVSKNFSTEEPSTSFIEVGSILEEKELLAKVLEKTKEQADMIDKPKEKPEIGKHEEKVETEAKIEKQEPKIDSLEVKKRQEYLRAQRDKLVALKKEARRKQLDVDKGSKDESKSRPKSAKAAQAVLTGVNPSIEYQQLQLRKTLADRLKAEVVAGKK